MVDTDGPKVKYVGNPAERAHNFLSAFLANYRNHQSSRVVLDKLFTIQPDDAQSQMNLLRDIWSLPKQIADQIDHIEDMNTEPYRKTIRQLETVLSHLSLYGNPAYFVQEIPDGLMDALKMTSVLLERDVHQAHISDDQSEQILTKINSLITDIEAADLDIDFKNFALDRLDQIVYVLERYRLVGTQELLNQVDILFGGLVRQTASLRKANEDTKAVLKKLLGIGGAILMFLEIANQGLTLEQRFQVLLNDQSKGTQTAQIITQPDKSRIDKN